jgi:hypothetical protein
MLPNWVEFATPPPDLNLTWDAMDKAFRNVESLKALEGCFFESSYGEKLQNEMA